MNYIEALEYIHSVCWKGSVPGLSRISKLLSLMGNPEQKLKYVHIVGTNGKGSTASIITSVLKSAGYKAGMYTSPFIVSFNERIQINGQMISDECLAEITEYIKPFADSMEDRPTEFELVTAVAFEYFYRCKCDIVVLEAGMGGEFDATNVIPSPEVAVFTNIGLDHTDYLGDTVEKIALTKSGILKKGSECVIYPSYPSAVEVIKQKCESLDIPYTVVDFDSINPISASIDGQIFDWAEYKSLSTGLLGAHQRCNAATALTAVKKLAERGFSISEENVRNGLLNAVWQGRFEVLRKKPLFIVDGGHNPQCMEALAENIRAYFPDTRLTVLTGVLADKDYAAMYDLIAPYVKEFILVTPPSPRALPAKELGEKLLVYGKPITVCETVCEGVEKAVSAVESEGAVLAFGSLYMIGDIKQAVDNII